MRKNENSGGRFDGNEKHRYFIAATPKRLKGAFKHEKRKCRHFKTKCRRTNTSMVKLRYRVEKRPGAINGEHCGMDTKTATMKKGAATWQLNRNY